MRSHSRSRAVFWRTGVTIITLVGVVQLAWFHHSDSPSFVRSASSPIGLSQVWSAYWGAPDAAQDWDSLRYERQELETLEDAPESGSSAHQAHFKQEEYWCSEAEFLDGEWVLRDEEVTMENIRSVFQYTVRKGLRRDLYLLIAMSHSGIGATSMYGQGRRKGSPTEHQRSRVLCPCDGSRPVYLEAKK